MLQSYLLIVFIHDFREDIFLDISGMAVNITKEKNGAKMTFRLIPKFWFIFCHVGSTLICLQILLRDLMPVHSLSDMSSKRLMVSSRTYECSSTFFRGQKADFERTSFASSICVSRKNYESTRILRTKSYWNKRGSNWYWKFMNFNDPFQLPAGRSNPLGAVLLLFYLLNKENYGEIAGVSLGRAGINILAVYD